MRKKNTEEMIEKMASFDYQLTRAERTKLYNLARSSNSFIRGLKELLTLW